MPKPTKGPRLGSSPTHQKMMLGGLAAALIREERIRTTETKGKRLRPVAEKLVTLGKDGSVHARRQALKVIEDRDVIHKLFDDIGPRFSERNGGYTRMVKLGPRQGDAAPMVIVEFVEHGTAKPVDESETETKRRRGLLKRRAKAKGSTPAEGGIKETPAATAAEGRAQETPDLSAGEVGGSGQSPSDGPSSAGETPQAALDETPSDETSSAEVEDLSAEVDEPEEGEKA